MFNSDGLIDTIKRQPFRTARVILSSGEAFTLTHPEQLVVTDMDDVIIMTPGERPGRVRWRLVGLDHIQSVELAESA